MITYLILGIVFTTFLVLYKLYQYGSITSWKEYGISKALEDPEVFVYFTEEELYSWFSTIIILLPIFSILIWPLFLTIAIIPINGSSL